MKVKVINVSGKPLDWLVATCECLPIVLDPMGFSSGAEAGYWVWDTTPRGPMLRIGSGGPQGGYSPTTSLSQGGLIMEREKISPVWSALWKQWVVPDPKNAALGILGPTFLVAAMRRFVVSRMGDDVELPSLFSTDAVIKVDNHVRNDSPVDPASSHWIEP